MSLKTLSAIRVTMFGTTRAILGSSAEFDESGIDLQNLL